MSKPCEACGNQFVSRKKTARFCSRPCMWSRNGRPRTKDAYWWKTSKGYIAGRVFVGGAWKDVKQHRWLMEIHIGRSLEPHEDIHHRNGDKSDNRLENLEIVGHSLHSTMTNGNRTYKRGLKHNVSSDVRRQRSEWMKHLHLTGRVKPPNSTSAALRKARGE